MIGEHLSSPPAPEGPKNHVQDSESCGLFRKIWES